MLNRNSAQRALALAELASWGYRFFDDGSGIAIGRGVSRLKRSPLVRALLASAAIVGAIALAGCQTDGTLPTNGKAMVPLSPAMLSDIEKNNMDKDSPILVRVFKQESELEIWKQDRNGRFALLKTYPICRWSGELGPKIKEGDRQAPEGFYTITPTQMNPNSQYYLSFDLGYPNAFDRAHGRTGAHLMVHGDCSSRGCYSMTDEQISEIYALGREAFFGGQRAFQVQAYPFRMTPANMAKHRNNPHMAFWKMLKKGYDHFEVTRLEPKVNVCDKRYVFDAYAPGDASRPLSFSPSGKCPVFEVPEEVATAVRDKQRRDEYHTAELITRGTPAAPVKTYADGGMHPVFAAAVKRNEVGAAPAAPSMFSLASVPGTIPAHVRPPKTPEFEDAPVVTASAAPLRTATSWTSPTYGSATDTAEPPATPATASAATTSSKSNSGNFFGGLFSSSSKPAADKKDNKDTSPGPLDRMAKLIGLRGSDPTPAPTPSAAAPAARPKPKPTNAAPGAIRPKPVESEVRTAEAQKPAPAPAPTAATPATTALSGAAPTVPAGSFESRWQGFR
jgi:murein L,D-transpeptidase YafK